MADFATAALLTTKSGIEVLEKLGALEKVVLKLKANPDKAAARLTQALNELKVGYTALHSELVDISVMSYESDELKATKRRLRLLATGRLRTELESAKGSCALIDSIYHRYLTGWFDRVLTKPEALRIRRLFADLADMDGNFIRGADALSEVAKQHATEVLAALQQGDSAKAELLTSKLARRIDPMLERLGEHMQRLWELQASFIRLSRAV